MGTRPVAVVVGGIDTSTVYALTDDDEIVMAADLVTLARTGVELDYRGDVIDAHAPEMPTRFAKQLTQIMRGGVALGMTRADALQLVIRCARDSMPQLRLDVLRDVAANPNSKVIDVRRRLQKPRATIDRVLQALHILGLLVCEEEEAERAGRTVHIRRYGLAEDINLAVIADLAAQPRLV
jgi:predicted transcriptional regulator